MEAALKRGFIQDDQEWIDCLQEATCTATPSQLRSLFITILIFMWASQSCSTLGKIQYIHVRSIKQKAFVTILKKDMLLICSSIVYRWTTTSSWKIVARLPWNTATVTYIYPFLSCTIQSRWTVSVSRKNESVYNTIINAVRGFLKQRTFFVDGPGGSGKTFCITHF